MLRPTGRKVLIRPDTPADTTDGGLIIPEQARDRVAMSGRVIRVGPECDGPSYRIKADAFADVFRIVEEVSQRVGSQPWKEDLLADLRAQLSRYYDLSVEDVAEGAEVCFPYTAGTDIADDSGPMVLVRADDIVATWHPNDATVETAA